MQIMQRAEVHGVTADVTCTGRFYDFLAKRDGRWGIVRRQPIYEKDRLDPVDPAAQLSLDPKLLGSFPVGYRHLAYLQYQLGYQIAPGLPGLRGPAVDVLYQEGRGLAGRLTAARRAHGGPPARAGRHGVKPT